MEEAKEEAKKIEEEKMALEKEKQRKDTKLRKTNLLVRMDGVIKNQEELHGSELLT